jgi:DNA-binding NtrC family response regulator
LRDRVHDIPELVWRFVAEFSDTFGKRITSIAPRTMTALQRYEWPGNVRELRNLVERAMILVTGHQLTIALPTAPVGRAASQLRKLEDVERTHIRAVLESTRWRIRGVNGAAEQLGVKPTTLESRMARLGVARPV